MDLLMEYTQDFEELQRAIMLENNPRKREELEMQLEFVMELFSLKVAYKQDCMELAKMEMEDRLISESNSSK